MSSSRVHMTFTGLPTAFDVSTASVTKSASPRRPNPPPRYVVWIFDLVGRQAAGARSPPDATPSVPASAPTRRSRPRAHPPCSSSAPSSRARGTALRRRARTSRGAVFSAAAASPSLRATLPGCSRQRGVAASMISALFSVASGPSFHLTSSACDALRRRPVVVGDDGDAAADLHDVRRRGPPSPCRR